MVQWHSYEGSFTGDTSTIDLIQLKNYSSKILNLPGSNELTLILTSVIPTFWGTGWVPCHQSSLHSPLVADIPPIYEGPPLAWCLQFGGLTCTMRFFWKSDKNMPFHCVHTNMACMIKFHWDLWWRTLCNSSKSASVLKKKTTGLNWAWIKECNHLSVL